MSAANSAAAYFMIDRIDTIYHLYTNIPQPPIKMQRYSLCIWCIYIREEAFEE
jgi:hypothetical protein